MVRISNDQNNHKSISKVESSKRYVIPKVIHYCWFGKKAMPADAKKCIDSWKRYLPDYEIREWNEDNYDLDKYKYVRQAYNNKKYAYVTDVVRLDVLYDYGGIYMDTDVEVLKSLDPLLQYQGFSGFESETSIPTGTMGAERNNGWIKEQLEYYKDKEFDIERVVKKHITNVDIITKISIEKHGLIPNGMTQELKYGMMMFPKDFLCAKSPSTGKVTITNNTYTVHHFSGSWVPAKAKQHKKLFQLMCKIIGESFAKRLLDILRYR